MSSAEFLTELTKHEVLAIPVDTSRVRMVTHLEVDRNDIERAVVAVRAVLKA